MGRGGFDITPRPFSSSTPVWSTFTSLSLSVIAARRATTSGIELRDQPQIRRLGPHVPQERAAEMAARTLALPDAQSVEDLTAPLTSAEEP
jgi:hypothetical protein